MREDTALADSAGHTMIDIAATRPAELERTPKADAAEEDKERTNRLARRV